MLLPLDPYSAIIDHLSCQCTLGYWIQKGCLLGVLALFIDWSLLRAALHSCPHTYRCGWLNLLLDMPRSDKPWHIGSSGTLLFALLSLSRGDYPTHLTMSPPTPYGSVASICGRATVLADYSGYLPNHNALSYYHSTRMRCLPLFLLCWPSIPRSSISPVPGWLFLFTYGLSLSLLGTGTGSILAGQGWQMLPSTSTIGPRPLPLAPPPYSFLLGCP